MKRVILLLVLCLCLGCAKKAVEPAPEKTAPKTVAEDTSAQQVERTLSPSCVAVYDLKARQWDVDNNDRASEAFLPASTFKILHTLIALQSSVVTKDEVFKWDGVKRNYEPWNRDLTLEQAFRHSAIWVFQRIAKRIGKERMQNYVDLVGYGNGDISGQLDSFWLDGKLRITPRQQVWFLTHLYQNDLPFSSAHMDYVKRLMRRDSGKGWTMHAKSGWAQRAKPQVGWLVGWVEKDGSPWFFATNVEINQRSDAAKRYALTETRLRELDVIPAEK
ncbi:class D beta-lactamase [Salidesulfovibrio onnuriiensis]|uniref:class D beta-lactamase n=1 Tax=Salidesulfovibrio onnuriiensis TaxID=2583823 RepID=UPI0011C7CEAA|nr:class D beta-lactamase [Salidesulfovibrio onnuriiensis]